jgi:Zinc-binding dehydrogenase
VTPVLDRSYPLSETAQALQRVGEGHARGKTTIIIPGLTTRPAASSIAVAS